MKYTGAMTRMQQDELPNYPVICGLNKLCVYRVTMMCDVPRINKGNGDATCHRMGNRAIYTELAHLVPISD